MIKLIILDRDGVINHLTEDYVRTPETWQAIPDSLTAIARLNHAGYQVAVATNQSGIGRTYYSYQTLNAIHDKMLKALSAVSGHLDMIAYCPHHPNAGCNCRKPKPGMLHRIAYQLNASLSEAIMVGDTLSDIQAGHAAGCQTILVRTGKGEQAVKQLSTDQSPKPLQVFNTLACFVETFLKTNPSVYSPIKQVDRAS